MYTNPNLEDPIRRAQQLLDRNCYGQAAEGLKLFIDSNSASNAKSAEVSLARRVFSRAKLGLAREAEQSGNTIAGNASLEEARVSMALAVSFLREPKNDGTFQLPDALEEQSLILSRLGKFDEAKASMDEAIKMLVLADRSAGERWTKETIRLGNALISHLSFLKECLPDADRLEVIDHLIQIGFRHSPKNQNIAGLYCEKAECYTKRGEPAKSAEFYGLAMEMFNDLGMDEAAEDTRLKQAESLRTTA